MLFFLIDMLMIALLIAGRQRSPEAGSRRRPVSKNRPADAETAATPEPRHQPGSWAVRQPQQAVLGTSPRHSNRTRVRATDLTGVDIPVWTALDDHQLTRLLKQSSS